ncbi:MAG: hypothetical protein M1381_08390 [Deltaproteobacteria bacterium]|nr:hypothetical protein [Deltaproteobacteria bacterium]MCL5792327.1 hypothetical protein [Deltaproteobacteria bacterium]
MEEDKRINIHDDKKTIDVTLRLFTKIPNKMYEDILREAIALGFEALQKDNIAQSQLDLETVVNKGMYTLEQNDKKKYELSFGCIAAMLYNERDSSYEHWVYYPEDESYDFTISRLPISSKPDYVYKSGMELFLAKELYNIELTQVIKKDDLYDVVLKKLDDSKHDYKGRVLFVIIKCAGLSDKDREALQNKLSQIKQNNFQSILFLFHISPKGYAAMILNLDEKGQWQWDKKYCFDLYAKTDKIVSTYKYYRNFYSR